MKREREPDTFDEASGSPDIQNLRVLRLPRKHGFTALDNLAPVFLALAQI